MALAGAMNVSVETSTSSSGSDPGDEQRDVQGRGAVRLVATAMRRPAASASSSLEPVHERPTEETQPVSRHSLT